MHNRIVDDGIGRRADQPLRQRFRLRKKAPGPEAESQSGIRPVPRGGGGDDVEDRDLGYLIWVIERQAIGDPPAAIVSGNHEMLKTQLLHDLNHVSGHGGLAYGL